MESESPTIQPAGYGLEIELPPNLDAWHFDLFDNPEETLASMRATVDIWESLRSFFHQKGYTLYHPAKLVNQSPPPVVDSDRRLDKSSLQYPYARNFISDNTGKDLYFDCPSSHVRAARDSKRREVVIKVISDGTPSSELEIMKFLNTKEARADPRNHTIPVIEFVNLQNYTFVVMPRWGPAFCHIVFNTVRGVLDRAQTFLEVFVFLHEHRIAHLDFLERNSAVNALYSQAASKVRDPSNVGYALLDFGISFKYPENTSLDDARETKFFNFAQHGLDWNKDEPYNPFALDCYSCARILERRTRHIENIVPELGSFFDSIKQIDMERGSRAAEALRRFTEMRNALEPSVLSLEIDTYIWHEEVPQGKP